MLVAIDTETYGLGKKFAMGCVVSKERKKAKVFTEKTTMWNYLKELAKKEKERGHQLTIIGHNVEYDFYAIADLTDHDLKFYSSSTESGGKSPFIVNILSKEKEIIATFLDTYSLYRMSLKKAANLIGMEKGKTPQWLIEGREPTQEEWNAAKKYMETDARICLDLYTNMKERLKQEGVNIRKLFTIHQIGISYIMHKLRKEQLPALFYETEDKKKQRNLIKPRFEDNVLEAYRGARVEAFQTGKWERGYCVDVNSLYPYSIINMKIPDLRTETIYYQPLTLMTLDKLLNKIGVSTVMIEKKNDGLPILPVRLTSTSNYYPKKGLMIGTWTHTELKKAIEIGYEIKHILKSIVWKTLEKNPFKEIYENLYSLKQNATDEYSKWFYKSIMNSSLGKMGQRSYEVETVIDSVEEVNKYLDHNYKIVKGIELEYMYQKKHTKRKHKKYYCPLIPTLVNAYARVYMYDYLTKIPRKELLYTDTDNMVFTNVWNLNRIKAYLRPKDIGMFKIEGMGKTTIYGKKTYKVGKKISVGGVHKASVTEEDFDKGLLTYNKQITIKTARNIEEIGDFTTEQRDLIKQESQHHKIMERFYNQNFYIDRKLYSITPFIDEIKKWQKLRRLDSQ